MLDILLLEVSKSTHIDEKIFENFTEIKVISGYVIYENIKKNTKIIGSHI